MTHFASSERSAIDNYHVNGLQSSVKGLMLKTGIVRSVVACATGVSCGESDDIGFFQFRG